MSREAARPRRPCPSNHAPVHTLDLHLHRPMERCPTHFFTPHLRNLRLRLYGGFPRPVEYLVDDVLPRCPHLERVEVELDHKRERVADLWAALQRLEALRACVLWACCCDDEPWPSIPLSPRLVRLHLILNDVSRIENVATSLRDASHLREVQLNIGGPYGRTLGTLLGAMDHIHTVELVVWGSRFDDRIMEDSFAVVRSPQWRRFSLTLEECPVEDITPLLQLVRRCVRLVHLKISAPNSNIHDQSMARALRRCPRWIPDSLCSLCVDDIANMGVGYCYLGSVGWKTLPTRRCARLTTSGARPGTSRRSSCTMAPTRSTQRARMSSGIQDCALGCTDQGWATHRVPEGRR